MTTRHSPTITDHLRLYGLRTFASDRYWDWAAKKLGRHAAVIDNRRGPVAGGGHDDPKQLERFYSYVADPAVFGPVTSQQTDDIAQMMVAVTRATEGRKAILDVGCSLGYLSTWLARRDPGRQVTGLDNIGRMVRGAEKQAKRQGLRNVRFIEGDMNAALPSGFDAVVDSATLQYAGDPLSALRFVRESLLPGGILVSVPQLGTPRLAAEYLSLLDKAGLCVTGFDFVLACDLGRNIARPRITATTTGSRVELDIDAGLNAPQDARLHRTIPPSMLAGASELPGILRVRRSAALGSRRP